MRKKSISSCLRTWGRGGEGRGYKGAWGNLESNGNGHRLDEGDYFVDVYIYVHLIKYILKFVQYIFILVMLTFKFFLKFCWIIVDLGLSHGTENVVESACNTGDLGSISGLGRSPGEGKGYPLQYSHLENSMDRIVHGITKNQTRMSNFHFTS